MTNAIDNARKALNEYQHAWDTRILRGEDAERVADALNDLLDSLEYEYAYEVDGYWTDEGDFEVEEYRHIGDTSEYAVARRIKAGEWEKVS